MMTLGTRIKNAAETLLIRKANWLKIQPSVSYFFTSNATLKSGHHDWSVMESET